ncbi:hypothetical protein DACRYDRAFT_20889 [Dacryopinax primogenitus]|uniref:EF-hand domain-containing protein n=1 Tax=Dacryopinax primogenitus (strain DJM 731) TaxID=1858805 RepID=M5G853_DACPD|nr:uncharacterized protein DACRYDRAFT_20889 [Dacryopinax primogenitus]EJU04320.1 hypothetical protein DACRYDRAFT_20889 [Dacryopinax primogenitus]
MSSGRSPHQINDSFQLSAYPSSRSDADDTTTLHSDIPVNSSRVNLVGRDMTYNGAPASEDDHNVSTPKAKNFRQSGEKRPHSSRNPSWDMLGGVGHQFNEGFEFKTSTAKEEHLRFAEGDFAVTPMSRFYAYLLNLSIFTRWTLYILPVLGLLWIPGILGLTVAKDARMATVPLLYWSIWFSVVWAGWWAAFATAMIFPRVLRATVGVVLLGARKYIDFLQVCERYVAFLGWSIAIWISFTHMLELFAQPTNPLNSALTTIAGICEALFISSVILLVEKLIIQYIALAFHETSYADRLAVQKMNVKILVILYRNSSNIPGRLDTMNDDQSMMSRMNPKKVLKDFLHGVRSVAETSATALGNIATEIAGASVLQPNSPEGRVQTALSSANKSRLLARRLYYSFRNEGAKSVTLNDIARFFPDFETAQLAFTLFDKDGNGDATRDEMEMACMETHRERLSLAASMKNLDSAVGRLDAILVYIWFLVAILVLIACLDTTLYTSLSAFGGSLLALSWLFGGTATEILSSIIFLFIKHPYDCGDRVDIDGYQFTVKEIQLLSTIFMTTAGKTVQCSHAVLNTKYVENVRRSGQMSESFTFDVDFSTTFEQLEKLRAKMLAFVTAERRDYLPAFDVIVQDIPAQGKMSLSVMIKYKSNWQQVALHAQRHNKWVCALKEAMHDCKIFGPAGAGNPSPPAAPPSQYTLVPWEEAKPAPPEPAPAYREPLMPRGDWNLSDRNAVLRDDERDVFGVSDELTGGTMRSGGITSPSSTRPNTRSNTPEVGMSYVRGGQVPPVPSLPSHVAAGAGRRMASGSSGEEFEMRGAPRMTRARSGSEI